MKRILAASAALGATALVPSAALAQGTGQTCSDFASPIIIVKGYDPDHLDADGNGIACEMNPGDPTTTDLYADLRDPADKELAHTGAGDVVQRHPVRTVGTAALLVGGGAVTLIVVRRRTRNGE